MHITALCPFCRSAYQVQATLRGQLVRCPNAACRKVFPVPEEEPPAKASAAPAPSPSAPPDNGQRCGSVGDLVPMMPTEAATPSPPSPGASKHVSEMLPLVPTETDTPAARGGQPTEADWWQAAPPVRGTPAQPDAPPPAAPSPPPPAPPASAAWWHDAPPVRSPQKPAEPTQPIRPLAPQSKETAQMPVRTPETSSQPRELPPGVWDPPPVRRDAAESTNDPQAEKETAAEETHRPPLSKRRAWLVIAALFLLTFGVLGSAGVWAWMTFHRSEEARLREARGDYEQGSVSKAEKEYRDLLHDFSTSEEVEKYQFMAKWCAVCRAISDSDTDPAEAAAQLDTFANGHKKDHLWSDCKCGRDAGKRLLQLAERFAARNTHPTDEQPLKTADRIEQLRRKVAVLADDALTKDEAEQIDAVLAKVRRLVEQARKRRDVLAQLSLRDKETPIQAIKRIRALLARMERELPDIAQDPKARAALDRLYQAHRDSVIYLEQKQDEPPPKPEPIVEDVGKTRLFAPLLSPAWLGKAPPHDPIVLALVRGVLYALKQSTGELKWAFRVGIDTTVLPQPVPAWEASPELFLVLSADTQTLLALDAEGDVQWEYPVGQRVLGRPILIEHRAYLAAYDGWVHEIELSQGQLLGRWRLSQRLTRGGVREGDTSRIYFPADDSCIYVLDVDPKKRGCVAILEDGHRSGSLRSEPVIIPPEGANAPGYLILNQASGLDSMRLRVFELPLRSRFAAPLSLDAPARLAGWTWFEPKQDGEKLAVLSDAGILGLFGIRQAFNRDQALFPMLRTGGLDLSPFLQSERKMPLERGRAQVVHMEGNDLWVLAHGRLQRVHLGWKDTTGLQASPVWKTPRTLGSPLHEPQRLEDRNGRSDFILVTQSLEQQICLASKVDEEGKVLWQRQLGLVCQGEPLVLTPPGGGPPQLLALDQGGGLFALDPSRAPHLLAAALEDNPQVPPRLLPGPDGHSAYEVATPGDGRWLIVRRIDWADGGRQVRVTQSQVSLVLATGLMVPAGTPAVLGRQLIVPMTNGRLMRLPLADMQDREIGPEWRDRLAPATAPGYVLALGGDRFLTTDGSRGLLVYEWPLETDKNWQRLPKQGEPFTPLDYLVAAPPLLLPSANGQPPRVAVADSAGVLHLFIVAPDGKLQRGPTWELQGKPTMGPFLQAAPEGGWRIGCVLDRRRLSWIDPAQGQPPWTYSAGSSVIVGQPRRIDDLLVVALQSGQYLALDPHTGQPKDPGYTLRTSAAPAAAPVHFGPDRLFAPLSDGTALLLPLELLREKGRHP